jgi:hypothetical protein
VLHKHTPLHWSCETHEFHEKILPFPRWALFISRRLKEDYSRELKEDYSRELKEDYSRELKEDYSRELKEDYSRELKEDYSRELKELSERGVWVKCPHRAPKDPTALPTSINETRQDPYGYFALMKISMKYPYFPMKISISL